MKVYASKMEYFINQIIIEFQKVKYNKNDPQHLSIVSLFARIIEFSFSNIVLLKNNCISPISVITRSLLEAYADLINNISSSDYPKRLAANSFKEQISVMKAILYRQNNTSDSLKVKIEEKLEQYENYLNEFKTDGIKPITISEKLANSNLLEKFEDILDLPRKSRHVVKRPFYKPRSHEDSYNLNTNGCVVYYKIFQCIQICLF